MARFEKSPIGASRSSASGIPVVDLNPFDRAFLADPYPYHEILRDTAPVVWLEKIGAFGMARYDEVRASLADWETFCSGRGVGLADFAKEKPFRTPSLLLETDPPLHRQTRGLMSHVASLPSLRQFAQLWRERADMLVDQLLERGTFDGVRDLSEVYPMMVLPDTIGLIDNGPEQLLRYAAAVFNAFGPQNDIFHEMNEGLEPLLAWIDFACRRENLKPGGWGLAVHEAAAAAGFPEDQRALLVRSFLSAGVDTTVNGIGNMLHAFSRHPEQWDLLRSDMTLTKKAFEESLRWDGTVQTFFRTTTRDVDVAGGTIPQGSKVLLFLAAANRDPRKWNDPETFDITRQTSGHVGFGFGIHQCLGQMVARQEAEAILTAMAAKVKRITPTGNPERRLNNTLRALASLPLAIAAA